MIVYKRPVSVLVVIHTTDLLVLLLERAAHAGYWQSVTGSLEEGETAPQAAAVIHTEVPSQAHPGVHPESASEAA